MRSSLFLPKPLRVASLPSSSSPRASTSVIPSSRHRRPGQAGDLDEAGGDLSVEVREYLGGAVFRKVAYHPGERAADMGQLRKILDFVNRPTQGGHRFRGAPVTEDAIVGFVLKLHKRRDRLQGAGDLGVLQGDLLVSVRSPERLYVALRD